MEKKYIYIRNNVKGYYIEFPEEIDAEVWAGKIGETYEDFQDGKWIPLSDEQVAFHEEHPTASIAEVIAMEITPTPPRTLEQAKQEKIWAIEDYDRSDAVNSFTIVMGDDSVEAWITPDQRANYKNSLDSAELLGLTEVHPVFNGVQLTLPIQLAKMALAKVQIYADRCFIVTETHKAAVEAMETIAEVDDFDITADYPEKLTFNLNEEE